LPTRLPDLELHNYQLPLSPNLFSTEVHQAFMMDPLSVTASIVGLILAAGQVTSGISTIKSFLSDAPRVDHHLSQTKEIETCLAAIQNFLSSIESGPKDRMGFIKIEHLVATLTQAVLTFSELEALVKKIVAGTRSALMVRVHWTRKQNRVADIMLRLESHKSTLSSMLSIVQWLVDQFETMISLMYLGPNFEYLPVNQISKPADYQQLYTNWPTKS